MSEPLVISRAPWTSSPAYDVAGDVARHAGNYAIVSPAEGGTILATVWVGKGARFGDLAMMTASPRLYAALLAMVEASKNSNRGLAEARKLADAAIAEVEGNRP